MSVEQVYEQHVKPLQPGEQLRLVEKIVHELAGSGSPRTQPRRSWREIRGIAPNLLEGEDAQEWVSRSRREDDEHSQQALRGDS